MILKAARKLFLDKGFRRVTVESIAKKAELSKGSIYLYYQSKEEIYSQILLNDIDKFHKHLLQIVEQQDAATASLHNLAAIYLEFFLNERELFRILMTFMLNTEHMNLSPELHGHLVKTTNKTINVIESILERGIERGEFPAGINVRQVRNAIWGMLNGVISLHLFTGSEIKSAERIRSTIKTGLDVVVGGLVTKTSC